MTERHARTQLRRMLRTLTAGSVLSLLHELFEAEAAAARLAGDDLAAERCESVAATLAVVGLGGRRRLPAMAPDEKGRLKTRDALRDEIQTMRDTPGRQPPRAAGRGRRKHTSGTAGASMKSFAIVALKRGDLAESAVRFQMDEAKARRVTGGSPSRCPTSSSAAGCDPLI